MEFVSDHRFGGDLFLQELKKYLEERKADYEGELISDLSWIANRAVCLNGIEVDEIQYFGDRDFQLDYSFDWEVYNGCADMDESGERTESVSFEISNHNEIIFNFSKFTNYKDPREFDY